MKIAREGAPFVFGFYLAGAVAGAAVYIPTRATLWALLASGPFLLLGAFSTWFFRDPDRTIPDGPGLVVAPADGKVVAITSDPDGPSVAIFLNVFDVHVNRAPIGGRVESATYRAGQFRAAFDAEAGEVNERNELVINGDDGRVRVRQIAGLIARRIVCRVGPGDALRAGERFGLIRFGSRTDLRMPPGSDVRVRIGERVRGGETVVGLLPVAGRRTSTVLAGEAVPAGHAGHPGVIAERRG